jgi:putative nucleotidyltransferase with HDIG domain
MLYDIGTLLLRLSAIADDINYYEIGATKGFPQGKSHMYNVALYTLLIATKLNFSQEEKKELFLLSIIHDLGFLSAEYYGLKNDDVLKLKEHIVEHCISGEKVNRIIFKNDKCKNVVSYHHENWNGTGFFSVKEEDIPLYARILRIAEAMEENFEFTYIMSNKKEAIQFLENYGGRLFDPSISSVYVEIIKELEHKDLELVSSYQLDFKMTVNKRQIYDVLEAVMKIMDIKSNFTFNHSHKVANLSRRIAKFLDLEVDTIDKLTLAGYLHDLGKLYVPKKVLEKPGPLTEDEYTLIKKHCDLTDKLLKDIEGFDQVVDIIHSHHERIDGSGYPLGLKSEQLSLPARILAAADVICSLAESRPYRDDLNSEQIKQILIDEYTGKLDPNVMEIGYQIHLKSDF